MFTRQRYVAGDLTEQSLSLSLYLSLESSKVNVSICPNTSLPLSLSLSYPLRPSSSVFPTTSTATLDHHSTPGRGIITTLWAKWVNAPWGGLRG